MYQAKTLSHDYQLEIRPDESEKSRKFLMHNSNPNFGIPKYA